MENIKLELIYLLENVDKYDILMKDKLCNALKYYLSRASNNVRCPKLIQQNKYIADVYNINHSSSRNVIYSPTKTSFPIAANFNCEFIRDIESKLFMIDKKGSICVHSLEYTIPILIALFSGPSFNKDFKLNGSLLMASLILSVDIEMKLNELDLSTLTRRNISFVLVTSTLMFITKEPMMYIIGKLLKSDQIFSVRDCLELVSMANYPPTYSIHETSEEVQHLLAIFEKPFVSRTIPIKSAALDNMFFCLPRLSPLSSILSCVIPKIAIKSPFTSLHLSINTNLSKGTLTHFPRKSSTDNNVTDNIRRLLATIIVLCRTDNRHDLCHLLSTFVDWDSLDETLRSDIYDRISVSIAPNSSPLMILDLMDTSDRSLNEHLVLDQQSLQRSSLDMIGSSLNEYLVSCMHAVIGSHYGTMIADGIDQITLQDSVQELLHPFFEYPGLD